MGQIRVTGTGRLKVKPDTTRLVMTLAGTYKDYEDAMKHSADDTEDVKKSIMKFGIGKEDIKTVTFSVDASYENYNKKGEYDRHFVGYEYNHVLKVEFANNNELLGKILYALAHSDTDPEISIRYTVKDPEQEKTKLLGDALRDAERKAEALAHAAGEKLSEIKSIDYSWGEVEIESRLGSGFYMDRGKEVLADAAGYDLDIEPDEIEMKDTVTATWDLID